MIEATYLTLVHHDLAHRQLFIGPDIIVDLDEGNRVLGVERVGGPVDIGTLARVVAHLRAEPLVATQESSSSDTMSQ